MSFSKRILSVLLCILSLSSCRFFDKVFNGDAVARVGSNILYESDIDRLNISGLSPADSQRVVNQYIYSWAKDILLMDMAETQLSKDDKNVEKQLEDYRRQLLVFRYEKRYVEQRLDTAITDSQYREFYESNKEILKTEVPIVKGVFIRISNDSPYLRVVKSIYNSRKPDDMQRLEEICYTSAEKYKVYDDWVSMEVIAEDLDLDIYSCAEKFRNSHNYVAKNENCTYLVTLDEIINNGSVAPYEYSKGKMKDIILSRRKQELISSLEQNLLKDAIGSNKFTIYSK